MNVLDTSHERASASFAGRSFAFTCEGRHGILKFQVGKEHQASPAIKMAAASRIFGLSFAPRGAPAFVAHVSLTLGIQDYSHSP